MPDAEKMDARAHLAQTTKHSYIDPEPFGIAGVVYLLVRIHALAEIRDGTGF